MANDGLQRHNQNRGVLPLAALIGVAGLTGLLAGLGLLAWQSNLPPACDGGECVEQTATLGEVVAAASVLAAGVAGLVAAVVGARYSRTGEGRFGVAALVAVALAALAAILLAMTAR